MEKENVLTTVLLFSEPKRLNFLFKQILPYYGERPFEELLTLLRKNQRINNHEINSLIQFLSKQFQFQLRTKLKLLEPVGNQELIQMAFTAKIINQKEKTTLEKFIRTRNDYNQKKIKVFTPKTMVEVGEVLRKLNR